MKTATVRLTVLLDPPFWAGLFERESGGAKTPPRPVIPVVMYSSPQPKIT